MKTILITLISMSLILTVACKTSVQPPVERTPTVSSPSTSSPTIPTTPPPQVSSPPSLNVSNTSDDSTSTSSITDVKPITAGFSASKTKVLIGEIVKFEDESTGDVKSRLWDFGDNVTSTQWNPSHSYGKAGVYTVSFKVSNADGSDVATKQDYIHVSPLAANIIFCSNVTQTWEYTINESGIFKPGEDVWVQFEVTGFDQRQTRVGYELWLKVKEMNVGTFNADYAANGVPELHETNPTPKEVVYLWLNAGKYQPTGPMYLGFVKATIEDVLSGYTVTSSHAFLVK